jgi:hypothetical protein
MTAKKDAKKPVVKKAEPKKAGKKGLVQKRLIEEAATANNDGKPVRGPRRRKPVVPPAPKEPEIGTPMEFTISEFVDVDNTELATLDLSARELNRLTVGHVADDLIRFASPSSLLGGISEALNKLSDSLTSIKRQHKIRLGKLTAELEVEEYESNMKIRLNLNVTRFYGMPAMLPNVDAELAKEVLQAMFEKELVVSVDFSNLHDYKYQVAGTFLFHYNENMSDTTEVKAPIADTPTDAIRELFYMVYEHNNLSDDHAVELDGDGCSDMPEMRGFMKELEKGKAQ